jgi:hypothetical protein
LKGGSHGRPRAFSASIPGVSRPTLRFIREGDPIAGLGLKNLGRGNNVKRERKSSDGFWGNLPGVRHLVNMLDQHSLSQYMFWMDPNHLEGYAELKAAAPSSTAAIKAEMGEKAYAAWLKEKERLEQLVTSPFFVPEKSGMDRVKEELDIFNKRDKRRQSRKGD